MHNQDKETLSALLDNEADELELRRLLKNAGNDSELADTWQRMNLVQAVLHDDNLKDSGQLIASGRDFGAAVMQAIEAEPVPQTTAGKDSGKAMQWTQPLAKLGIAASVALAFFLGMQISVTEPGAVTTPVAQQQGTEAGPEAGSSVTLVADSSESTTIESAVRQVDPAARQRLEEYIQSVSITPEEPPPLEPLRESRLYRLVNENPDPQ